MASTAGTAANSSDSGAIEFDVELPVQDEEELVMLVALHDAQPSIVCSVVNRG